MVGQSTFALSPGHSVECCVRKRKCVQHILCSIDADNFFAGREEHLQAVPAIGKNGCTTCSSFEEASGRAIAVLGHGSTRDIQSGARRAEEGWMQLRRQMRSESYIPQR